MATQNLTKWICDLCGESETITELKTPEGWVKITIDDAIQERCWYDKVICHSCLELIKREKNKSFLGSRNHDDTRNP